MILLYQENYSHTSWLVSHFSLKKAFWYDILILNSGTPLYLPYTYVFHLCKYPTYNRLALQRIYELLLLYQLRISYLQQVIGPIVA